MAEKYLVSLGAEASEITVEDGPAGLRVKIEDKWHSARLEQIGQSSLFALLIDDHPHELFAIERAGGYDVVIGPDQYSVAVNTKDRGEPKTAPRDQTIEEHPAGGWVVLSPMAGVVRELRVQIGHEVADGDVLMMIEAMKMNNELRAQSAGAVRELYVKVGQRVELGMPLLLLR